VFCAGRVAEEDLRRVNRATGAAIQTTVNNIIPSVLGTCATFEEIQVGANRYNMFTGCSEVSVYSFLTALKHVLFIYCLIISGTLSNYYSPWRR
jgi:chaperonin GroEL (HSP60 family)